MSNNIDYLKFQLDKAVESQDFENDSVYAQTDKKTGEGKNGPFWSRYSNCYFLFRQTDL